MTDLKVFKSSEFGELGVMTVNGKEYFPATRCAKILGYKEPEKAIREKCKGVSKLDTPTAGGIQQVNYIPEGDLYRLIVSSKLPAAEKFESWVFDEVLPSIRQAGGYGQNIDLEKIISQTAAAVAAEIMKHMSAFQCFLCAENEEGKAAHLQSADENGTPAARCQEAGRRYDSFGRIFLSADCKLHCEYNRRIYFTGGCEQVQKKVLRARRRKPPAFDVLRVWNMKVKVRKNAQNRTMQPERYKDFPPQL